MDLSRRSIIKNAGSLVTLSFIGGKVEEASASEKKAEVLAFVGDRWHSFDYIRTALTKTIVEESGVKVDFTPDNTLIRKDVLKKYKLFIMLSDGMQFPGGYTTPYAMYDPDKMELKSDPPVPKIDETPKMWITEQQGRDIKEFVNKGGSAWFFHNASYISSTNADYRDVEGALFTGHTPFLPYRMKVVDSNRNHPILQGVKDFTVTEEQHFVIYDKDKKYVLMTSENETGFEYKSDKGNQGTSCESCWAYDYGKGRVCFMAPGHTIYTFWNPEYVKLQKNALKWLLKEV